MSSFVSWIWIMMGSLGVTVAYTRWIGCDYRNQSDLDTGLSSPFRKPSIELVTHYIGAKGSLIRATN